MQQWYRLHHYPSDYLNLVYRYYAAHGQAYICTYYHLDIPNSNIDTTVLDSGAYEDTGEWSGYIWEKIVLLPIYNTETVQSNFTADERGFGKFDQTSSFNIPSIYEFTPTALDFVFFEELVLNEHQEGMTYPLYQVINFSKATNTSITFWQINLEVSSKKKEHLDLQVRNLYSFVDYEKQLYQIDEATQIYKILERNSRLNMNDLYKETLGYYLGV